jgi:hypothetical protein
LAESRQNLKSLIRKKPLIQRRKAFKGYSDLS